MFMHPSGDSRAGRQEQARPDPAARLWSGSENPPPQDTGSPSGTGASVSPENPPRHKRGRPRTRPPGATAGKRLPNAAGAAAEAALVAETGEVISNLQRQGVLKPPAASLPGGGPGHRTKNCRPVQINLSETMFRQLKMIAATQSISIKDQIIAALVQQGYKS